MHIASGSIINVKSKGKIDVLPPLQNSRLSLTGIILPDSPYLAKFVNMATINSVVKIYQKTGLDLILTGR